MGITFFAGLMFGDTYSPADIADAVRYYSDYNGIDAAAVVVTRNVRAADGKVIGYRLSGAPNCDGTYTVFGDTDSI